MIQDEGVLNRFLFDESDLTRIKDEIIKILKVSGTSPKLNSIWMNYSGSSGVGGPTKASSTLNIGKKDPVLQYMKKLEPIPEITNLVDPESTSNDRQRKNSQRRGRK
jgi:hypothetical protein